VAWAAAGSRFLTVSVIEPSLLFTKPVLQPAQHHTVRVNIINLANLLDEDELRITRYGFSCSHS
jgi:hypothetical protein